MPEKKYSLEWNSYSDHLRTMMNEMLVDDHFADVTLVTEDKKQINAHLNILSACSPFFKDIVKKQNNSIIYLRGIHFKEVKSILQFIYLGKTSFQEEMLNEFLSVAKSLEIKELSKAVNYYSRDETDDKPPSCDRGMIGAESFEESVKSECNVDEIAKETENQFDNVSVARSLEIKELSTAVTYNSNDIIDIEPSEGEESLEESDESDYNVHDVLIETKNQCDEYSSKHSLPKMEHEGVKYDCDQCDYQSQRKHRMIEHIQSKHEGVKFSCGECDKQFSQKESLTDHIKFVHQGRKCSQCDYQASNKKMLFSHIQTIHKGVKYNCDQCDYQASNRTKLTYHIQSKHEGVRHACDSCNKQFLSKSALAEHIKKIHEGRKFSCSQCDFISSRQSYVTIHIQSMHKGVKYDCDQCDYQANFKLGLTHHIQSKHEGVQYVCGQCDKEFSYQGSLTEHIQRKHEGKRFACNMCDYKAIRKNRLRDHFQSMHEGVEHIQD